MTKRQRSSDWSRLAMENRLSAIANEDFADRLDVFFGQATDTECHVYARFLGCAAEAGLQLRGTLTGPSCAYAETLPATFRFADRGPGDSLLAEAIVPEPCFWTPDMPHQYQAEIQFCRGSEVLARASRLLGIRALGVQGRNFYYDAQRWVLRGLQSRRVETTDLNLWRAHDAVMMVENPSDDLCRQASRVGVLLAAQLDRPAPESIRRLSRWPAVGLVILPNACTIQGLGRLGPNLVFAQHFGAEQTTSGHVSVSIAPSAHVVWCEAARVEAFIASAAGCPLPVVACRPAGSLESVAAGRILCDRLQRDLAGQGEFAGYVV